MTYTIIVNDDKESWAEADSFAASRAAGQQLIEDAESAGYVSVDLASDVFAPDAESAIATVRRATMGAGFITEATDVAFNTYRNR